MKIILFLALVILVSVTESFAFEVKLLASNKEAFSRELSQRDLYSIQLWAKAHPLKDELKVNSLKALEITFNEMERIDTNCELGLVSKLAKEAIAEKVISSEDDIYKFIKYLRSESLIDDLLYQILNSSAQVQVALKDARFHPVRRPYNAYTSQNSDVDLAKFYEAWKTPPNDIEVCTLDTYWKMVQKLTFKSGQDRDSQISKLNYIAFNQGIISQELYGKLEILRSHQVLDWPIFFKRYADIINNSKDKLTAKPEASTTNPFSVKMVSRKEKITQRSQLYMNYDSTQIMIMAQVIEKTAKRMDATSLTLNWRYTNAEDSETEIYVLSPMEQYRVALKMLKKDYGAIMRSESFRGQEVDFEHLICAAYETGFVTSAELEHVLNFEDLWNPRVPRWKAFANFAFSLGGTAAFYLPAPYNILGAIGLIITQSKVVRGNDRPDPDDNWNTIL